MLPIPDALLSQLVAAEARQAAEKLALGEAYTGLGYVVCNEAGEPYHPSTPSTIWQAADIRIRSPDFGCWLTTNARFLWQGIITKWTRYFFECSAYGAH